MPIPQPYENETQNDFIQRCVLEIGNEYPQGQAVAICESQWDNEKVSKLRAEKNNRTGKMILK